MATFPKHHSYINAKGPCEEMAPVTHAKVRREKEKSELSIQVLPRMVPRGHVAAVIPHFPNPQATPTASWLVTSLAR